jgi:hypothetical protein
VASLLQLKSQKIEQYTPFPPDLPPSDDPGTSEWVFPCICFLARKFCRDEELEPNDWALIAPDYESSDSNRCVAMITLLDAYRILIDLSQVPSRNVAPRLQTSSGRQHLVLNVVVSVDAI